MRTRKVQLADAPGGGGGVPTNGAYMHVHEHNIRGDNAADGVTHAHAHWHYAGTTMHANGTTVAHDHEHGAGSPAAGANDRYKTGRAQRDAAPRPGSAVSSVTADPVKSAEILRMAEKLDAIKSARLARQAKTPPTELAEQRRRKEVGRSIAERLTAEGINPPQAWLLAHDPAALYAFEKAKALKAAELASPTRASSSIALVQPKRQAPSTPEPEKQPGESQNDFYKRVRNQVAGKAQPADVTLLDRGASAAEERYQKLKAAELSSEAAKVREVVRSSKARQATTFKESGDLVATARALMRTRGQATPTEETLRHLDPQQKAAFREAFARALKEVS